MLFPPFSICSTATIDNEVNLKFAWDIVNGKLTDCLNAITHEGNFGNGVLDYKRVHAKRPSSLYAVAEGPRFRLLWASFQWLKEEVTIFLIIYYTLHTIIILVG